MANITAAMHRSEHATAEHPVLLIDGSPLDVWLNQHTAEKDASDLVPAQGWLVDEKDLALAWRRLAAVAEDASIFVPLLICPDDVDFSCTVVVVEQEVRGDKVIWHRFGYDRSLAGDQVGTCIKWFDANTSVSFHRPEFVAAVSELRRLTDEEWI
jgi:hypothetical protein